MKIIKILLAIFLILILAILYLSIFGIKTDKFNNQINNNILKINKKIKLKLNDVKYLLNPYQQIDYCYRHHVNAAQLLSRKNLLWPVRFAF